MQTTKHTPGPWAVEVYGPSDRWVRTLDGEAIVEVGHNQLERQANAKLIAAAPELLEALQDALSGWRYIRQVHGDLYGVGWDRVEQAAQAAIAKATQ